LLDGHGQQLSNEDLEEMAKELSPQEEEEKRKDEEPLLKCMKTSNLQHILYVMHVYVFWCAAARMSELKLEQRTNIKFLVKFGKSGNEIREMLVQVYGDNAMKKTAVYKWVKRFSEGRESVTDEERSGQPATSRTEENTAKIHQTMHEICWLTVRSIA